MNWPETMMQEEVSVRWCLSLQQHSFLKGRKKTEDSGPKCKMAEVLMH